MACTPAKTCKAALAEATALWPSRYKGSDGICSSASHQQQNPNSDHDYGNAWDLTHDPAHGCDVWPVVRGIVARRDRRVKYVIWNRTIWRSYDRKATDTRPLLPAWQPERYTGSNPHTAHCHVSILSAARDDVSPWIVIDRPAPPPQELIMRVPDACQSFAVLWNNDLVLSSRQGHVYHFDADGVERGGDDPNYIDAYVNHPELAATDKGPGTHPRQCLGVYALDRDRKAVPNGHPLAVGYCQVFDDGSRYHWTPKG